MWTEIVPQNHDWNLVNSQNTFLKGLYLKFNSGAIDICSKLILIHHLILNHSEPYKIILLCLRYFLWSCNFPNLSSITIIITFSVSGPLSLSMKDYFFQSDNFLENFVISWRTFSVVLCFSCSQSNTQRLFQSPRFVWSGMLTLFDIGGGGGAWWPPKMFLTTVPRRLRGGSWNLVTFNIYLCSIKKKLFLVP